MALTLAINRYDRHVPFFNGTLSSPKGFGIEPLEVGEGVANRDGDDRHSRMLKDRAFDIAEVSLSSYIMAVARDPDLPLAGIPIFPRRLFSMGQIYVNASAGIETPQDLIGRKVGVHTFQTTVSLLAKGDLKQEYGVPWERIHWIRMRPEIVPVDLGPDVRIETVRPGMDIGTLLCDGEIDALISPQPPLSMLAQPERYRRLFADVPAEETRYFKKYGFYPVMHLLVAKRDLVEENPALGRELLRLFEEAKTLTYSYYDDPNYALLADARLLLEQQRAAFGPDPWINGFKANRKNLEQFIRYSHDQRLISAPFPPEHLFHPSTHDS